jgi:branched-chain amino acid transport system substrate-binding protein
MRPARLVASGLLASLLVSACGSRLPDEVLAELDGRRTASTGELRQEGVVGAAPTAERQVAEDRVAGTDVAAGGAAPQPGAVTGEPGEVAGETAVAPDCAQAASAAPGVTDDEIKVASIVTDSGPLPGATEGAFRAASAYFAMRNAMGGVCGRRVTLLKGDDGLDPAKARGEFLRLEPNVLAFVGSFAVADSGYIDLISSTGVPYVATVIDPDGRGPRNVMPRTATGIVSTGPFVWWKQQHPDVERAAVLFADVGGVSANVPGFERAVERAGFDRRYTAAAGVANPAYPPEVQQAQNEGIEFLYLFAFEVNMHIRIIRNMRQQNYDPPIKGSNIGFNTRFSELLGTDGDGWENHNTHLVFLDPAERDRSEALGRFIDWNERVFPGAQLDLFPVSGWAMADLFTRAMERIQGDITRESLVEALYTIEVHDGGGIEAPVDPTTGIGEGCWNMAVHRDGNWVRQHPTDALFDCETGELYRWQDE